MGMNAELAHDMVQGTIGMVKGASNMVKGAVNAVKGLDKQFDVLQKKATDTYKEKPKVVRKTLDEIIKERYPERQELKPTERVKREPVKEKSLSRS
jgi:hypothetical protein